MPLINIRSAKGNAPTLSIVADRVTDLGTLDTNRVHILAPPDGSQVTIESLGVGHEASLVTKRIVWDAGIKLHHNPPKLVLDGGVDRTTAAGDWSIFTADEN